MRAKRRNEENMGQLTIKKRVFGEGKPLLCVPVMETKKEDIIREVVALSQSEVDMIEWRVDAYDSFADCNAVREVLEAVAPVLKEKLFLYTFRTKRQGGEASVDAELLDDLHDLAAESGCVDLVDMEYFEEEKPAAKIRHLQKQGIKVVASHHDFDETPSIDVMKMLLVQMSMGGADVVKLAVMPQDERDVLNLLIATAEFHHDNKEIPLITMSMGGLGSISRLCGETFGSCVTFGAGKKASAPGQFERKDLAEMLELIHKSNPKKE